MAFAESFFQLINNRRGSIKYIIEEGGNGELPFLNILLKRNRKISVLVNRKPTYTGKYFNHNSHHKGICKESVISFCNKAIHL